MKLENGKQYGVCESCGEIYEILSGDLIKFDGKHHNCDVPHEHFHLKYAIEICPKCTC